MGPAIVLHRLFSACAPGGVSLSFGVPGRPLQIPPSELLSFDLGPNGLLQLIHPLAQLVGLPAAAGAIRR